MKRFGMFSLPVLLLVGSAFAADRNIVVPEGTKAFKVAMTDIVRITGTGIAGAKIDAKIAGPAKLENTNTVHTRVDGANKVGQTVMEFEVKPTGKGKVTVTVSVTMPQPGSKPVESKYEFTVE